MSFLSGIIKVGEGYNVADQDIPIDIHYHKLLDWLIDRKKANDPQLKEAASKIISLVSYEIPALKKTIDRCQKQSTELSRKETETLKNAQGYKDRFEARCKELGIDSALTKDTEEQLSGLVKELPTHFSQIIDKVQLDEVGEALEYFASFIEYVTATTSKEGVVKINKQEIRSLFPMSFFLRKYGNTTDDRLQRFLGGEDIPEKEEEEEGDEVTSANVTQVSDEKESENSESAGLAIDWSALEDENTVQDSSISVSEGGGGGESGGGITLPSGIEWDLDDTTTSSSSPAIEVNWDIEVEENQVSSGIEIVDESMDGGIDGRKTKKGTQDSILSGNDARNNFLNELLELQFFFKQRIVEMDVQDTITAMNQLKMAPKLVQQKTGDDVKRYLNAVSDVISRLNSNTLQQLLDIKDSRQFVKRLALSIKQLYDTHLRLKTSATEMMLKRNELETTVRDTYPQLRKAIEQAKQLKKEIESNISKQFNNRPVTLIGDINNL